MDNNQAILVMLQYLQHLPYIGHVIVFVLDCVMPLSMLITAFCTVWQAVVRFLDIASTLPKLSRLKNLSDKLKANEILAEGFINQYIIPYMKILSAIPVPVKSTVPKEKL